MHIGMKDIADSNRRERDAAWIWHKEHKWVSEAIQCLSEMKYLKTLWDMLSPRIVYAYVLRTLIVYYDWRVSLNTSIKKKWD